VVGVHHEVPRLEVAQPGDERAEALARAPGTGSRRAGQQLRFAVDGHSGGGQPEAAFELAFHELDAGRADRDATPVEQLLERREPLARRHQQHAVAALACGRDVGGEARQLAVKEVGRRAAEVDRAGADQWIDHQARPADQRVYRRGRMLEQLGLDGEAAVLATRRVLGRQAGGVALDLGADRLGIEGDHQRVAERFGQRVRPRCRQRQEILPTRKTVPPGESIQVLDRLELAVVVDQRPQHRLEPARRLGAGREERQRTDEQALEPGPGALRGGVEAAQAFDLAAEQVEPNRLRLPRGPEVEHSAAHREVPDFGHQVDTPETEAGQAPRQLVGVDLRATRQLEPLDRRRVGEAAEEGARCHHHRGDLAGAPAVEGEQLGHPNRQRRVCLLVRRERGGRKRHSGLAAAHQAQRLQPDSQVRLVRHDDEQRPSRPRRHDVGHPGGRSHRKPGRHRPPGRQRRRELPPRHAPDEPPPEPPPDLAPRHPPHPRRPPQNSVKGNFPLREIQSEAVSALKCRPRQGPRNARDGGSAGRGKLPLTEFPGGGRTPPGGGRGGGNAVLLSPAVRPAAVAAATVSEGS